MKPTQAQIEKAAWAMSYIDSEAYPENWYLELAERALTAAFAAAAQVGEPAVMGKGGYEYISSYDEIVAHTKLAVIERCAQVAENFRSDNPFPTIHGAIASAIRKLKDAP